MKQQFILITLFLVGIKMEAQQDDLRDNNWIIGYGNQSEPPYDVFGGLKIQWNPQPFTPFRFDQLSNPANIQSSISDVNGNYLFYSDGCRLYNADNELLEYSDSLNYPGEEWDMGCYYKAGYNSFQGDLILPNPGSDHLYTYFHLRFDQTKYDLEPFHLPESLLYSEIDMNLDGGLGMVTRKNQVLLKDTLCDNLTAVRHGNGRDWWIAAPKANSDIIHLFLLSPQGIEGPFRVHTGEHWYNWVRLTSGGGAAFSPNGTLYARASSSFEYYDAENDRPSAPRNGVHLYQFDRCTGQFFCTKTDHNFPQIENGGILGLAFSPNSRFLYVSDNRNLYQYDTWADDFTASRTFIGTYDGFLGNTLATTFCQLRLAPNGKIYMSATNGVRYLHVIHNPNEKGLACNFEQHGLELPVHTGFTLPNFPYFRLYDWEGSPCDTLGINAARDTVRYYAPELKAWPNPASQTVSISGAHCQAERLMAWSADGRLIYQAANSFRGFETIDVSTWASGVYIFSVVTCDGVAAQRVVVQTE